MNGDGKEPTMQYTQTFKPCNNMKLRMVIGGWTDYYVNHSDDWVAFNVHGTRVNVLDNDPDGDKITFQWDFNTLTVTVGSVIKALRMIDNWLEV
nr:MAG TPA: hypothetical protein [Caudoviricetes sp.]